MPVPSEVPTAEVRQKSEEAKELKEKETNDAKRHSCKLGRLWYAKLEFFPTSREAGPLINIPIK